VAVKSENSPGHSNFSSLASFLGWVITLTLFWIVLTEKWTTSGITIGLGCSLLVAWITRPLLSLAPRDAGVSRPIRMVPGVFRLILRLPWLAVQIFLGAFQVARVVLDPRMPIRPSVIPFRAHLSHSVARLTLANFITLTPGTVTLDVEGDQFTVHTLQDSSHGDFARRRDLHKMQKVVQKIFGGDSSP